jgi:phosphate transport system substrate-binding protein
MKIKSIVPALLLAGASMTAPAQDIIQVKGSDTMVNLVQRLAEAYMEKDPKAAVAVTGGGSGVGIAALVANQVPLADASREMKEKEYTAAKENGVVPVEIAVAIDALSIIVNETNPVKTLTNAQVGAIYRGDIKNWSEIGGPDLAISLYGRQPSSGTYVFVQEFLMGNKNYSPKMKQMNGNAQILEGVKADRGGIGYVGVGYVVDEKGAVSQGIRVLGIAKIAKSSPVSPLAAENVKSGLYPIARALYQYSNGKPKAAVRDFVAFELSPEGQKIVEEEGFYPVSGKALANNRKLGL